MAKKLKIYNGSSWEDVTFAITPPNTAVTNSFTTNQVIETSTSVAALRITQNGSGEAFRVEDEANPDASPFVITATGKVGIGTSSPATKLQIQTTFGDGITLSDGTYTHLIGQRGNTLDIRADQTGTSGDLRIFTNGNTERLRVDSSGRVGIGAASVSGMLEITHVDASAPKFISTSNNNNKLMVFEGFSGNLWNFWGGHGGGSYFGISENASSTPVFAITGSTNHVLVGYTASQGAYKLQVNSQIFATSASIATSDGRYKENVLPINSGLSIVNSLNPVSFDWKEHPVHNFPEGKTVGFIAQEVQEALSGYEWVNNIIKSNYNEEADEEFLGIAESNIIPLLVAALKEVTVRLEALESK